MTASIQSENSAPAEDVLPGRAEAGGSGSDTPQPLDAPIVFFDGECVMCNTFLDLMMAIDQPMTLQVAPLQGQTAQKHLPPLASNPEDWSIYLRDETGLYHQSDAVIRIAQRLGGPWSLMAAAGGFPKFIRDGVYRAIAQNRYRLFGKRSCRLPNEGERARFLP